MTNKFDMAQQQQQATQQQANGGNKQFTLTGNGSNGGGTKMDPAGMGQAVKVRARTHTYTHDKCVQYQPYEQRQYAATGTAGGGNLNTPPPTLAQQQMNAYTATTYMMQAQAMAGMQPQQNQANQRECAQLLCTHARVIQ
jgi:hypothetical protein